MYRVLPVLLVTLIHPVWCDLLVSKCCPSFQMVNIDQSDPELKCIPSPDGRDWIPKFVSSDDLKTIEIHNYKVKFGYPKCQYSILSEVFNTHEKGFIMSNGEFLVNHRGATNATFYCGDDFQFGDKKATGYLYCKEQVSEQEINFWKPVDVDQRTFPRNIPKCCPEGMSYDDDLFNCVPDKSPLKPYFREPQSGKVVFFNNDKDFVFYHQNDKFCPKDDKFPIGLAETSTDLEFHILTSGDLYLPMLQKVLSPSEYCIEKLSGETKDMDVYSSAREVMAFVCGSQLLEVEGQSTEVCTSELCLQKCCPQGESFDISTTTCQPSSKVFSPKFQDETGADLRDPPKNFNIIPSIPLCNDPNTHLYTLDPKDPADVFYLLKNGSIYLPGYRVTLAYNDFCLDHFYNSSQHEIDKSPVEYRVAPLLCFENCHFDKNVQCASGEEHTSIFYIHYIFITFIFIACFQ